VIAKPQDVFDQLARLRYDLTAAQAKITDIVNTLNALDLPNPAVYPCPDCQLELSSANRRAEHLYYSHGGPEPEHWIEAERLLCEARSLADRLPVEKAPTERSVA
jgi:hypothetical protein